MKSIQSENISGYLEGYISLVNASNSESLFDSKRSLRDIISFTEALKSAFYISNSYGIEFLETAAVKKSLQLLIVELFSFQIDFFGEEEIQNYIIIHKDFLFVDSNIDYDQEFIFGIIISISNSLNKILIEESKSFLMSDLIDICFYDYINL